MTQHISGTLDIDVDNVVEGLPWNLPKRGVFSDDSRIIEQEIRCSEMVEDIAGPSSHCLVVGYIEGREMVKFPVFLAEGLHRPF